MPTMVALMSEKSRLIRPGVMMMSLMPCTAWRSRSSATLKDSKKLVPLGTSLRRRSLGMAMTVSTVVSADVYFNVQGDEPLTRPEHIESLIAVMQGAAVEVGTLKTAAAEIDVHKPSAV